MNKFLCETLEKIAPADKESYRKCREIWDSRVHPIGSLGTLETMCMRIAAMSGTSDIDVSKKALVVMASDNGVIREGVSSGYPELTSMLVTAMAGGHTGAAALAKEANCDLFVVDLGTRIESKHPDVIKRRHRPETNNFMEEPAMSVEEAEDCIRVGIEIADELFSKGYRILGTGELGIANTTSSAAVMSALTGYDGKTCSGLGAGLDDEGMKKKIRVVDDAVKKYGFEKNQTLEILAALGGYDICGLTGVFLGAAKNGIPVIIDGFISAVAALAAYRLAPNSRDYMMASHMSCECQMDIILKELNLSPILMLNMRLGEGSACPLTMKIIDSAVYAMKNMGKFTDVSIMDDVLVNIREEEE